MIDLTAYEKVWYVSAANGAGGNGGTSWADAKATVAQGLALMSPGHALLIGPGTYTEQNDFSALAGILIAGSGSATILTFATGWTIKLGSAARVCDIAIKATKASPGSGEFAAVELTASGLGAPMFERVHVESTDIGIRWIGGVGSVTDDVFILRDSSIEAAEYGVQISIVRLTTGSLHSVIERCVISTQGWLTCSTAALAYNPQGINGPWVSLALRDSLLRANLPAAGGVAATATGLLIAGTVRATLENTICSAYNARDAADGSAYALYNGSVVGPALVVCRGCLFSSSKTHASADEYDLFEFASGANTVSGCEYDIGKTYGGLTDLDRLLAGANVDSTATETISIPKALEAILAHMTGKSGSGSGYTEYLGRDDATSIVKVYHDATGVRSQGADIP